MADRDDRQRPTATATSHRAQSPRSQRQLRRTNEQDRDSVTRIGRRASHANWARMARRSIAGCRGILTGAIERHRPRAGHATGRRRRSAARQWPGAPNDSRSWPPAWPTHPGQTRSRSPATLRMPEVRAGGHRARAASFWRARSAGQQRRHRRDRDVWRGHARAAAAGHGSQFLRRRPK